MCGSRGIISKNGWGVVFRMNRTGAEIRRRFGVHFDGARSSIRYVTGVGIHYYQRNGITAGIRIRMYRVHVS